MAPQPTRDELDGRPLAAPGLNDGAPRLSLGVPASPIRNVVLRASDIQSIMGFGHIAARTDVENGSDCLLFRAKTFTGLDHHFEADRNGPHIRLEHRPGLGILRMKARSLSQLTGLLDRGGSHVIEST